MAQDSLGLNDDDIIWDNKMIEEQTQRIKSLIEKL